MQEIKNEVFVAAMISGNMLIRSKKIKKLLYQNELSYKSMQDKKEVNKHGKLPQIRRIIMKRFCINSGTDCNCVCIQFCEDCASFSMHSQLSRLSLTLRIRKQDFVYTYIFETILFKTMEDEKKSCQKSIVQYQLIIHMYIHDGFRYCIRV